MNTENIDRINREISLEFIRLIPYFDRQYKIFLSQGTKARAITIKKCIALYNTEGELHGIETTDGKIKYSHWNREDLLKHLLDITQEEVPV